MQAIFVKLCGKVHDVVWTFAALSVDPKLRETTNAGENIKK
jgi:hypothetical protein